MRIRIGLIGAGVGALLASSFALAQTTLAFSSFLPPGNHIVAKTLVPWAEQVEKATSGRVKIRMLAKPVAAPPAAFEAVRDGSADIAYGVQGLSPGRFYSYQVAEMPFLAKSSEALSAAYWRVQEKLLSNTGEYTGAKLLTVFTTSAFQIHTTRVPIRRLSDFKGLKIRVSGGVQLDIADRLGIVPVLQPITQAYELLSGGVADGIGGPTQLLRDFKLTSVVRHTTIFPQGMNFSTFFFVMNQASFNALSQADRDAIMAVSGEALARIAGRNFDSADEETLAQMKASPASIETASPELIRDFRAAVLPVESKWIQDVKAKGLDGQALLAALRGEIRTLEK